MPPENRPRQLPLDLVHREGRSRDHLVVSEANKAAVALIDRWPDWPSPVVVLAGPTGSGKSHLGAIWREMSGALVLDRRTIGDAVESASKGRTLFIDDADAGGLDETGLFHAINAVRSAGTHMLLTARRFPQAWGVGLPDLSSRLKAAATVEIREPDDVVLAGVIAKLFADRQVEVDPHVVQFLVRRIERSLATAISVVERLDKAALEEKTRITRALAAEVVSSLDEGQGELDL
ncbi:DnaA regulatory inactivator HdaA [Mesorhizobium sp. BAC0120]|uniref:DnaA regulatory inactivator HdaA n=1 Tax=Mesorhizobium sp. BAC0120 TaxID=3090670 RepID=UPI00298BDCB3|nr:DnaA regulatory inactivator HdaA [Mesorhizobium sp. BAC0120]MDW6021313.1 DnaA regulatory inactivator HdaA [Mesorhizobium sp. BAC0120]